jgi:hypothetical protein
VSELRAFCGGGGHGIIVNLWRRGGLRAGISILRRVELHRLDS